MSKLLFYYQKVDPTTWAYLSSLLMIGLYFKFSRFWSVRNVDLVLLVLLAPGLLMTHYGGESEILTWRQLRAARAEVGNLTSKDGPDSTDSQDHPTPPPRPTPPSPVAVSPPPTDEPVGPQPMPETTASSMGSRTIDKPDAQTQPVHPQLAKAEKAWEDARYVSRLGYIWLLAVSGILLIRLLLDSTWSRRPLLEPNLSVGGLIFIGCSLFVFLMANVITSKPTESDLRGAQGAARLLHRETLTQEDNDLAVHGPGFAVLNLLPSVPTMSLLGREENPRNPLDVHAIVAKIMAILAHLAVVIGIIGVGYQHFENLRMGIGAATLYLMLPYTAVMTGRVDHVLPAALLIWAIVFYRRPLVAGIFVGLATGVVYYPLFLLPLWVSFYWQRGVWRFAAGMASTLIVMVFSLVLVSADTAEFLANVQKMFGLWLPVRDGLQGIWGLGWDPNYRLPVLAAFFVLSISLAIWPAQKNLGTLLSCSSAIMVATQFWHGYGGGLYMAWYLPLTLLTIFRPNLEDRVALTVLGEGWFTRRARAA